MSGARPPLLQAIAPEGAGSLDLPAHEGARREGGHEAEATVSHYGVDWSLLLLRRPDEFGRVP